MTITITMAKDFSPHPFGRSRNYGPFSADALREDHLLPALRTGKHVVLNLDGVSGMTGSYIEHAFGHLTLQYDEDYLKDHLTIKGGNDPEIIDEIWAEIHQCAGFKDTTLSRAHIRLHTEIEQLHDVVDSGASKEIVGKYTKRYEDALAEVQRVGALRQ